MKRVFKTAVFAFCLTTFAQAAAVPVQNMSAWSLGADYYGALNGHTALSELDESSVGTHLLRLHYAPFGFLRFSAGIGASHAYASPSLDGTKAGLTATGGVALYLPRLLDWFSLTGGYDGYYIRAAEDYSMNRSYRVSLTDSSGIRRDSLITYAGLEVSSNTVGQMHVPYIGAIFHLGRYVDFEVGGLYHYFKVSKFGTGYIFDNADDAMAGTPSGTMPVGLTDRSGKKVDVTSHSGHTGRARIYSSLTFHERESGAYLSAGASIAPIVNEVDEDRGWLTRFSPWVQVGIIIRDPRGASKTKSEYSETYIELKDRQDSMADALRRDIERDKERNREEGRDEHDFE